MAIMKNTAFNIHSFLPALEMDPEKLRQRLFSRPDPGEFLGLALAVMGSLGLAWQHANHVYLFQYDLGMYLNAAHGDFSYYRYGYWFLPMVLLLARLPFPFAFLIWNLLNIGGVFLACRIFGGKPLWVLTGYQMFYTLFQGNISGILLGGLALGWLAVILKKWKLAGVCFLLACTKYQLGIPLSAFLVFYAPGTWRDKSRLLIVPFILILVTFLIWGNWPLKVLADLKDHPVDTQGALSLWEHIGVTALLVWLPPFLLKLSPQKCLGMLICATYLGQPYVQQNDLIAMFSLIPNPLLPLAGDLGYLLAVRQFNFLQYLIFIPLGLYLWILLDALRSSYLKLTAPLTNNP